MSDLFLTLRNTNTVPTFILVTGRRTMKYQATALLVCFHMSKFLIVSVKVDNCTSALLKTTFIFLQSHKWDNSFFNHLKKHLLSVTSSLLPNFFNTFSPFQCLLFHCVFKLCMSLALILIIQYDPCSNPQLCAAPAWLTDLLSLTLERRHILSLAKTHSH